MPNKLALAFAVAAICSQTVPAYAESTSAKRDPATLQFIDVEELSASIVDGPRSVGVLRVHLNIETESGEETSRLSAQGPRLRQTLLMALSDFASLHASPSGPVDARLLAAVLTRGLQDEGLPGEVRLIEISARVF